MEVLAVTAVTAVTFKWIDAGLGVRLAMYASLSGFAIAFVMPVAGLVWFILVRVARSGEPVHSPSTEPSSSPPLTCSDRERSHGAQTPPLDQERTPDPSEAGDLVPATPPPRSLRTSAASSATGWIRRPSWAKREQPRESETWTATGHLDFHEHSDRPVSRRQSANERTTADLPRWHFLAVDEDAFGVAAGGPHPAQLVTPRGTPPTTPPWVPPETHAAHPADVLVAKRNGSSEDWVRLRSPPTLPCLRRPTPANKRASEVLSGGIALPVHDGFLDILAAASDAGDPVPEDARQEDSEPWHQPGSLDQPRVVRDRARSRKRGARNGVERALA
mmetsp:Transcript_39719/g.105860  ORF Transcript_39719/g.105860 Transcript_39719/m.105860 type:complete len:332 (+) Transcript_39719:1168-2163(+)